MALQIVLFLFQTQLRIWWSSDGCDGHVELVSEGNTYKQQTQWNQGLMGKCSFKQQLPCLGKVDKVSARVGVYLQPHVFCLEEKWDLNVLRFIHYFEINFKKSNFFILKLFDLKKAFSPPDSFPLLEVSYLICVLFTLVKEKQFRTQKLAIIYNSVTYAHILWHGDTDVLELIGELPSVSLVHHVLSVHGDVSDLGVKELLSVISS